MAIGRVLIVLWAFLSASLSALSQDNRYMVFFTDKTGSAYSINEPLEFLSHKALERREKHGVAVTTMDLPVNAGYVAGVQSTGAEVFFSSRWTNSILIQCAPSLVPGIEDLDFVDRVEFVAPESRLVSSGRRRTGSRRKSTLVGIETQTQLGMIGIPEMHADGYQGQGMTIAVFDGGFTGVDHTEPFRHIFSDGRFNDSVSFDFVTNSGNVFQYDDHGTEVLSVISASIPDVFTGGALKANFQLYVTEDVATEHRVEEYNWLFAAERADSAGADLITSSLGYSTFDQGTTSYTTEDMDGKTAIVSRAAQWASDRGILVISSAGNEGNDPSWRIITAPADVADVIAVANVNAQGQTSPSSSRGPAADGSTKPDLAALGTGVRTITGSGKPGFSNGTSLSTPLITSLAAGVWQKYPGLTNRELREALKLSASRGNNPNNEIGYGIPHYVAVTNYLDQKLQPNDFEVFPNPVIDTVIVRPSDPEKISSCIVEVISPQGRIVRRDNVQFNWLNRSHQVDFSKLTPGIYILRILAGRERYVFRVFKGQ